MTVRSFVYDAVRQVSISNAGSGSIVIEPGPRADTIEGSISCRDQEVLDSVAVRQDGDSLEIDVPRTFARARTDLRLGVPAGLAFLIQAGSTDIRVSVPSSRIRIRAGSGDITLGTAEDVRCSCGSGDIAITELAGNAEAHLDTGSGEIRLGEVRVGATIKSGSGDVQIQAVHGAGVRVSTGSGDIAVAATAGSVDLKTASGAVTIGVAEQLPAWLDLHAATGSVRTALEASAEPAPGERFVAVRARTGSGEIFVYRA